jgi:hypothetical protein
MLLAPLPGKFNIKTAATYTDATLGVDKQMNILRQQVGNLPNDVSA